MGGVVVESAAPDCNLLQRPLRCPARVVWASKAEGRTRRFLVTGTGGDGLTAMLPPRGGDRPAADPEPVRRVRRSVELGRVDLLPQGGRAPAPRDGRGEPDHPESAR